MKSHSKEADEYDEETEDMFSEFGQFLTLFCFSFSHIFTSAYLISYFSVNCIPLTILEIDVSDLSLFFLSLLFIVNSFCQLALSF